MATNYLGTATGNTGIPSLLLSSLQQVPDDNTQKALYQVQNWANSFKNLLSLSGSTITSSTLSGGTGTATTPISAQAGVTSGVTSGFNLDVTYPTPFPTGTLIVLVTPTSIPPGSTTTAWNPLVSAASTTGFTVVGLSTTLIGFSWLALGF